MKRVWIRVLTFIGRMLLAAMGGFAMVRMNGASYKFTDKLVDDLFGINQNEKSKLKILKTYLTLIADIAGWMICLIACLVGTFWKSDNTIKE